MKTKHRLDFDLFYKTFFNPLCSFIERVTGDKGEVADLAQDVFLKVYERWNEFETFENAKAFLYIAARNLCMDHLKHRKAEENYIAHYMENNRLETSEFLKEVIRQETFRILHEGIDRLPEQTRQVILLSMEGKQNDETAKELGISVNTVKTLKKLGYASLRKMLSKDYFVLLMILLGEF